MKYFVLFITSFMLISNVSAKSYGGDHLNDVSCKAEQVWPNINLPFIPDEQLQRDLKTLKANYDGKISFSARLSEVGGETVFIQLRIEDASNGANLNSYGNISGTFESVRLEYEISKVIYRIECMGDDSYSQSQ